MKHLFVTGMGRSGTSLLDKLLCAHPKIDLLSQPLPLLFVEAKKRFLESIGQPGYFVLNDDEISRDYSQGQFNKYLANMSMKNEELVSLFECMRDYSGQKTRPDIEPVAFNAERSPGFKQLLDHCLHFFKVKPEAKFVGLKEIMCEEYLPYLGAAGYKCIVILRDPRDVLASANYPGGEKYLGDKKPTLFLLRSWRKSAEFAWQLGDESYFHFLRYEDLVDDPCRELDKIANFLGISHFDPEWFANGIHDRDGREWKANSSGGVQGSSVSKASLGAYRKLLSFEERAYTEAVCGEEIDWLGYADRSVASKADRELCIRTFKYHGIPMLPELSNDYSSSEIHVKQELQRQDSIRGRYE
jgi:hypothetical protein